MSGEVGTGVSSALPQEIGGLHTGCGARMGVTAAPQGLALFKVDLVPGGTKAEENLTKGLEDLKCGWPCSQGLENIEWKEGEAHWCSFKT